jgi:class 3 adenylate cyclase
MKNPWTSLVNIGIVDRSNWRESRHVAFLNTIVLLVIILIIQNSIVTALYYPATRLFSFIFAAHFLFIGLTLVWNGAKHYRLGRVWFGLSVTFFLTLYSICMGPTSYWDLFLAVVVFLQFYIFPESERDWMIFVLAVTSVCFLGVHFLVPAHGFFPNLPPAYVRAETIFDVAGFLFCAICMGTVGFVVVNRAERNLALEHARSERLLNNILPVSIAQRLKDGEEAIADGYESATIMFFDLVNFTPLSASTTPAEMADLLTDIFSHLDQLVEHHQAEKINTMGDGYMAAAGLPVPSGQHGQIIAGLALDIQAYFEQGVTIHGKQIDFRIGINSGPLMAGVIGHKKISYTVWGDTVNTASRMESQGLPGQIQISESTYELIRNSFLCEPRGAIEVKGKGQMQTYLLKKRL